MFNKSIYFLFFTKIQFILNKFEKKTKQMPYRKGKKSAAQTPAPKSDRIYGSKTNPKGSASSRKSAKSIVLSAKIINSLKEKLSEFKKSHQKDITINDLKAVYRRGLGAYSSSHRPTITGGVPNSRNAWAMARVNKFLLKAGGAKVKAAYVQDDDLMAKGGEVKFNDKELLKKYKNGESIGFTATAHLKSKGLIPRADGTKRKSMADGGQIGEEAQQLIDIISMNPNNPKYDKYKDLLKSKFDIDYDVDYGNHDEKIIENANLEDLKGKDDFLNYDNYVKYAQKIFRLRGFIKNQPNHIEGMVDIELASKIGKKLDFQVVFKDYNETGNYAEVLGDTMRMPKEVDINTFIHEIGHLFDHQYSKEYNGKAKNSLYATSLYFIGNSAEVFAENFMTYFIAPDWLKNNMPEVYYELDEKIPKNYKEIINNLIDSQNSGNSNIRYNNGGSIRKCSKGGKTGKSKKGGGDCYVAAGDIVLNQLQRQRFKFLATGDEIQFIGTPYLVHAEVKGQGAVEGIRYGHAWIEDDVLVYDYSNGRQLVLPKELYYRVGDIQTDNPKKYQKYTFEEAKDKLLSTGNYGCWDLEVDYADGGSILTDDQKDLYDMYKLNKLQQMGDGGSMNQHIVCKGCGWEWDTIDSEEGDKYICHNCGFDNTLYYTDIMSTLKQPKTLEEIAEIHGITDVEGAEKLTKQLEKGIKTEMEHTTDEIVAKTIALHHIEEMPDYYDKLEQMEKGENIVKFVDEMPEFAKGGQVNAYEQFLLDNGFVKGVERKNQGFVQYRKGRWYCWIDNKTKEIEIGKFASDVPLKEIDGIREDEPLYHTDRYTNSLSKFKKFLDNYYVLDFAKGGMQELETTDTLKDGGVVVGKRHSESDENGTGERFLVKSTGQIVELEGGEGVLNTASMQSTKTFDFNGKKMTARQIASELNHKYGGVEFAKGGNVNHVCGCKSKFYHGGELPTATLDSLEGGEAVVTVKTMESKDKYKFNGREMTPREVLSKINSEFGGKKFEEGGTIDLSKHKFSNQVKMTKMVYFVENVLYL
jgi:hypothetical protein